MTSPGRALVLQHVTEAAWQAQVEAWAKRAGWLGYHVRDSRGSARGFPDCVFVRPQTSEIVFAELKTERGRVSPSQQVWIEALRACNQRVFVFRPADEDLVKRVLAA
jgi:hypothetical protein